MRRSALRFYWEKICSIQYLHFSFEKQVPSQVLKDFSVENLETTLSPFLSKFSSDIHLSPIINYWGSIFMLYLTWRAFSVVCVLSTSFFFLSFSFFSTGIFPDRHKRLTGSQGRERGILYFSYFPLPPAQEHSLSSSRFLSLLFSLYLIDLFVITTLITDNTCSPSGFAFYLHFHWCN